MVGIGDLYGDFKTLCKQWFYEKSEVDTALNSKQNNLVSGTNIKTINNTSLLGSGNIDIQGGGSGGSCVTDFYIDSNTDEWVIETSACSQGEVVTQWEQTLSDEKVPSEKLVKNTIDGFVQYELSSSNYNPTIDSNITITCTCKNVLGNPIANKTLELMMNGVSQGTSTTNANGIATWTLTMSDWGNQEIKIENQTIEVYVTGFKFIQSNITYALYVDESQRLTQIRANRSGVTIGTGDGFNYNDFKIPAKYRPKSNSYVPIGRTSPLILNYVWTDGTIGIYNNTGNQWTNYNIVFIHEWHY